LAIKNKQKTIYLYIYPVSIL